MATAADASSSFHHDLQAMDEKQSEIVNVSYDS